MIDILKKSLFLLFCLCVYTNAQESRALVQTDSECFISTWAVDAGIEFTLPTTESAYDFIIDWGDGSGLEALAGSGPFTHTYTSTATVTIKISGIFPQIYCNHYYHSLRDNNDNPDAIRLLTIEQWGPIVWRSMEKAFAGCAKLRIKATDTPNLSQVQSMYSMFDGCTVMNDPIGHWDVSSVTNMRYMFYEASAFNQALNDWDVSKVTNMEEMFFYCAKFNQALNDWDVSQVTDMSDMFYRCSVFNQDIGDWDVGNVTDMNQMFYQARKFNQDIGRWNVGKVTSFRGMFYYVTNFNHDLGNWDVRSANTMHSMFFRATAFDQNLSRWQIPKVTTALGMFNYVNLSIANYDALLMSWAEQVKAGTAQKNVRFHGGKSKYCQGQAARAYLIVNGWETDRNGANITDGGRVSADLLNISVDAPGIFQGEAGAIRVLYSEDGVGYYATTPTADLNTDTVVGNAAASIQLTTPALNSTTQYKLWADNNTCIASFYETITVNVYPKADIVNTQVELLTSTLDPVADGITEHKVKVKVYDIAGNLLPNAGVLLAPVSGVNIVADSLVTDANGEVTFVLTSTLAGTYSTTIQLFTENPDKAVTKNWGETAHKVSYTFAADFPDASKSQVELLTSANMIMADGLQQHVFKVSLRDAHGNSVPNHSILFDPTLANGGVDKVAFSTPDGTVFTAGAASNGLVTDAKGELIVYATTSKAWTDFETGVSFKKGSDNIMFNESPISYQFVAGGPNFDNSSIVASPASQIVGESVTLVMTILDAYNNPCRAQDVMIQQATLGGELSDLVTYDGIVSNFIGETDNDGKFAVTHAISEIVGTYSSRAGIVVEDVLGVKTKTVDYTFTHGAPDLDKSYVELKVDNAQANNADQNNVLVHIFDAYGNVVPGVDVEMALTTDVNWGSGYGFAHVVATDNKGKAAFNAVSNQAGTYVSEVTVDVGGGIFMPITSRETVNILQKNPVAQTFLPQAPGAANSDLLVIRNMAIADSIDSVVVSVTVKDTSGIIVSNAVLVFHATPGVRVELKAGSRYSGEGVDTTGHDAAGNLYLVADINGYVEVKAMSIKAGYYTSNITLVKDETGQFPSIGRVDYVFNPGLAVGANSKVHVINNHATVGGENRLRVELFDAYDNPVGRYSLTGDYSQTVRETKDITFAATNYVNINSAGISSEYVHTLTQDVDASVFDIPVSSTKSGTFLTVVTLPNKDTIGRAAYTFVADDISLIKSNVSVTSNGNLIRESNQVKASIRDQYDNPIEGVLIHLSATPGVDFGAGMGSAKLTTTQANGDVLLNIRALEAGQYGTTFTYSVDGSFPVGNQIYNGGQPAIYYFTDTYTTVDASSGFAIRAQWAVFDEQERASLTEQAVFESTGAKAWDINSPSVREYYGVDGAFSMTGFSSLKSGADIGANKLGFTLNIGASSFTKDSVVVSVVDAETQWSETQGLAIHAMDYTLDKDDVTGYGESNAKRDAYIIAWSLSSWENRDLLSQTSVSDLTNLSAGIVGTHPLTFTVTEGSKALSHTIDARVVADNEWFITTWETTRANETIRIPGIGDGYNFSVDWGDGSAIQQCVGAGSLSHADATSHTYARAGTYTVRISGTFPRIYFNNGYEGQDITKIKRIEQWGNIEWASMMNAFKGCSKLVIGDTVTSGPDLSNVTTLENMFRGCEQINSSSLSTWNVSTIKNMKGMFQGALAFNQPLNWNVRAVEQMDGMFQDANSFDQNLGGWDISALTSANRIFDNSALSIENYDTLLIEWNAQVEDGSNRSAVPFSAVGVKYCEGKDARLNLIANAWGDAGTINDGGELCSKPFQMTWKVGAGETITIPTIDGAYDFTIDWGDGTIESLRDGDNFSHPYVAAGNYEIKVYPNVDFDGDGVKEEGFPRIYFHRSVEQDKIISVDQWGDVLWESMGFAFDGCKNLNVHATDAPNLSEVQDLSYMFRACESLDANFDHWDVTRVVNMTGMFQAATAFNGNISNWETIELTDMGEMFSGASSFNRPLNWDVSSVIAMDAMFASASSFDQNLADWDIRSLVTADRMLDSSGLSMAYYDSLLIGWNKKVLAGDANTDVLFSALDIRYCHGAAARNTLIDNGWGDGVHIADGGEGCPRAFVTTWAVATGESISLPTLGTGYNFTIDWGDGTVEVLADGDVFSHQYHSTGVDTIKIYPNLDSDGDRVKEGGFPRIYSIGHADADKLLSIEQWGDVRWKQMDRAFSTCSNLMAVNAIDSPDLSLVTNLSYMFSSCSDMIALYPWLWDVSNVINMSYMFSGATSFNGDISSWDVNRVKDMSYMFQDAVHFDQAIGHWRTDSLLDMSYMFAGATQFNQDLSAWHTDSVTTMEAIFNNATAFDQNISSWGIAALTTAIKMLDNSGMSVANYDKLLINWNDSVQAGVNTKGIPFSAEHVNYCKGETARADLIMAGWGSGGDILDGGSVMPDGSSFTFGPDPTVCQSTSSVTFSLSGSETNVSYQLYDATDHTPVGNAVVGTGNGIDFTVPTVGITAATYYVIASNTALLTCTSRLVDEIHLSVTPFSESGTLLNYGERICSGDTAKFALYDYTGNIRWQSINNLTGISPSSSASFVNLPAWDGRDMIAEPLTSRSNAGGQSSTTYYYFRAIVENGDCEADTTELVQVVVFPFTSNGGELSPDTSYVLYGNNRVSLKLDDSKTGVEGNIVGWEYSIDGGVNYQPLMDAGGAEITSDSCILEHLTQTTHYRVVKETACSKFYSSRGLVVVQPTDYSDAPAPYDTVLHLVLPVEKNVYIGYLPPDWEVGAHASEGARGDDTTGVDDEDGLDMASITTDGDKIMMDSVLVINHTDSTVYLYAWIDYNKDNSFEDHERMLSILPGTSDTSWVYMILDGGSEYIRPESYYVRLRVSSDSMAAYHGSIAKDGEVEEHQVCVSPHSIQAQTASYFVCLDDTLDLNVLLPIKGLANKSDYPTLDTSYVSQWTLPRVSSAAIDVTNEHAAFVIKDYADVGNTIRLAYKVVEYHCEGRDSLEGTSMIYMTVLGEGATLSDKEYAVCYADAEEIDLNELLGFEGRGSWVLLSPEGESLPAGSLLGNLFYTHMAEGTADLSVRTESRYEFEYRPTAEECIENFPKVTIVLKEAF